MNEIRFIEQQVAEAERLNAEIQQLFSQEDSAVLKQAIDRYGSLNKDAAWYSFLTNYYFMQADYANARETVQKGLDCYPFHFDLNFNLGIIQETLGELDRALFAYLYALKYANDDNRELAENYVNRLIALLENVYGDRPGELAPVSNQAQLILSELDQRYFPLDPNEISLIRKPIESGTPEAYMTNMYRTSLVGNVNSKDRYFHKTETLKGEVKAGGQTIELERPTLIPVSSLGEGTEVRCDLNGKTYSLGAKELPYNRFHYLRFNEPGTLNIQSTLPVFVGRPIPLQDPPLKKRLVLNLFIDGISYDFLQKNKLEQVMPRTAAYFENSWKADHCYATSEWTFPSVATMFTGKYTTNHGVFQPSFKLKFGRDNKMMSQYFKEAGYFTANIGGDWRVTPAYGYHKGTDRTIYQTASANFDSRDILTEAIEHLEAFKHKNNFLWISLSDTHSVPDEVDMNLLLQSRIDISERVDQNRKGQTSVLSTYDPNKSHKYILEMQRVDLFLQTLYTYLDQNYEDEEVVVVLTSDHGQSFLEDQKFLLHESRRRVPLFVKGLENAGTQTQELIELTDLLPIILHASGLPVPADLDGRLPACLGGDEERPYAYTEAIHPNQTYKAVVSDHEFIFQFENKKPISNDGLIDLREYSTALIRKATGENETGKYPEKEKRYEEAVWNHIKSWLTLK